MSKFWDNENPTWYWILSVNMAYVTLYLGYHVVWYAIPNGYWFATIVGTIATIAFGWLTYIFGVLANNLSKKVSPIPEPQVISNQKTYTMAEFVAQYKEDLDAFEADINSEGAMATDATKYTYIHWCRMYVNYMSWVDR